MKKKKVRKKQLFPENWIIFGIFGILGFILYANTIPHEFALDDCYVITGNNYTKQGIEGIPSILGNHFFSGYLGDQEVALVGGRYRPLSLITFAIEYELFGENPHEFHFVNIVLYILTTFLLFRILKSLFEFNTQQRYLIVPFIAALLFLAHPVHTEVVANIKGRDEILSLLFSLLSFRSILLFHRSRHHRHLVLAFLFLFFALLSKENAVVFIILIPLSLYFFTSISPATNLKSALPLLASLILFGIIRYAVLGWQSEASSSQLLDNPFLDASLSQKYGTILYTLWLYIKLLLFPYPLTWDYYPYHIPLIHVTSISSIFPGMLYLFLLASAIIGFLKKKIYAYAILFYLISLSVLSNLLFPIGVFMAERFLFVPSIGFCLIVAWFLFDAIPAKLGNTKRYMTIASSIIGILFLLYSVQTISRNRVWKDDYTLYTTDVTVSSNSAKSNNFAGKWFGYRATRSSSLQEKEALTQKAFFHLKKSIAIHPTYQDALFYLGSLYYDLRKDIDSMLYYYQKVLELDPEEPHVWKNIPLIINTIDNKDRQIIMYENLLQYNADRFEVNYPLGVLYYDKGNYHQAASYLEKARVVQPTNPAILNRAGFACFMEKNYVKAKELFSETLRYHPQDTLAKKNLAAIELMLQK